MIIARKKINLALDTDLNSWVDFKAGVLSTSVTGYINHAIRKDKDESNTETMEAFKAFEKLRKPIE